MKPLDAPVPVLLLARELGIGGTERQLAVTAKSLDRRYFTPHAGCFHHGFRTGELREAGVPVVQFPVTSFRSWSAAAGARLMGRFLRENRIRLVHTFDTPLNVWGVPVARAYGAPVVLSSQRALRELSGRFRGFLRFTDRLSDGIVVNCLAVKRQLLDQERVPEKKIHLCYNGIDTDSFHPAGRRRADPIVIGTVCALRPEKGLDTLVEAFRRLPPGPRLRIVGSGPMLDELRRKADGLDCSFEPATQRVAEELRSMDIFVLPSRSEALSNSLMEAMACGACSVASDVGGNPELVKHESTGLLFRSGDAVELASCLQRLLGDASLRDALADRASAFIRDGFTLQASARRMEEIYSMHLKERP